MTELVTITDQKAVTTSLIVAEAFDKRHDTVLRSISRLECSDDFRLRNFAASSYLNEQNKPQPMYQVTRDGFTFLAMGFTGKRAAEFKEKFIAAFNTMEQALLEGAGDRRRVDVNYNHQRGITNPHGLDIKYTLDLTKIALKPSRAGLAIIERLTGVPMDDILPEASATESDPNDVARFVNDCCIVVDDTRSMTFKRFYDRFRRWYADEVDAAPYALPSKREVGKRIRELGHTMPSSRTTSGVATIRGLELAHSAGET